MMDISPPRKSTVEQIRARFDNDVERFSNLNTGQAATIDAPLALDLIAASAALTTPHAQDVLDVGCGAGNYTLKLLGKLPDLNVTLVDLSPQMVGRAEERIGQATHGTVTSRVADIRELPLAADSFDIVLAAAVLHHLRTDAEWEGVLGKFYECLRPGGSIWISDMVDHALSAVGSVMRERYGQYLAALGGEVYRDEVFAYIEQEDTPKPLLYQTDLLGRVGFKHVEILHKNTCFAAFGAVK